MKKYIVIGGGAREHAIVQKLRKDDRNAEISVIPGNAGTAAMEGVRNIDFAATDTWSILQECVKQNPDLVIVGPENSLERGVVDILQAADIRTFGPTRSAAELEWSKSFAKDFMQENSIPTADARTFDKFESAWHYVDHLVHEYPTVIKANGLALGKGVVIANNSSEAYNALVEFMAHKKHGEAGKSVLVEEFLNGPEATLMAFVDGKNYALMPTSQDHKRVFDNDQGPNTGGMGAFSPATWWSDEIEDEVKKTIVEPTIRGMSNQDKKFKGILYFGLINTQNGVKIIEYNTRFGDPETQTVLPLLKNNLVDVLNSCIDGTLDDQKLEWEDKKSLCVVMASEGYPESTITGRPIEVGEISPDVKIVHAGTRIDESGQAITNGGRVMSLVAQADTMEESRGMVYGEIDKVKFEGAHYRTDIGKEKA